MKGVRKMPDEILYVNKEVVGWEKDSKHFIKLEIITTQSQANYRDLDKLIEVIKIWAMRNDILISRIKRK